jgi:hypothetical protein
MKSYVTFVVEKNIQIFSFNKSSIIKINADEIS